MFFAFLYFALFHKNNTIINKQNTIKQHNCIEKYDFIKEILYVCLKLANNINYDMWNHIGI